MRSAFGRLVVFTTLLAALTGCMATAGVANVATDHDPAQRKTGLALMSLTISGYTPGTHWYQIVNVDNPQQPISLATNADTFGYDWNPGTRDGKSIVGRVAAIELPNGSYEVRRWIMNVGNTARFASRRPIAYRFNVESGKAVYIGNIHTDIQQSASSNSLPYAVSITNEKERDLPIVLKKFPRLQSDAILVRVPQFAQTRDTGPASLDSLRDLLP